MLIVCPSCKTRFSLDDGKVGAEGIKLRCSKCRAIFRVVRKGDSPVGPASMPQPAPPQAVPPAVKQAVPPVAAVSAPASDRVKVVVAHESASFCAAVQRVLAPEPFDVFVYNDGRETLAAIEQMVPAVVLLDVALPSMYGFEVCDAVRKNPALATVKIILIASIYDKTRYKRSPKSLYGADDYIEKHHIPDSLAAMVYRLVADQKPVEAAPSPRAVVAEEEGHVSPEQLTHREIAEQEATREEIRQDEEQETSIPATKSSPELAEAHVKAKRLARIIVSDVVLYNQAQVEEGVRNGTLFKLMADDIREGASLYERRVSAEVRAGTDYLKDAFDEFIAKKKKELGL